MFWLWADWQKITPVLSYLICGQVLAGQVYYHWCILCVGVCVKGLVLISCWWVCGPHFFPLFFAELFPSMPSERGLAFPCACLVGWMAFITIAGRLSDQRTTYTGNQGAVAGNGCCPHVTSTQGTTHSKLSGICRSNFPALHGYTSYRKEDSNLGYPLPLFPSYPILSNP